MELSIPTCGSRDPPSSEATKQNLDHQKLGLQHCIFFFHPSSPGSAILLPRGTCVFTTLLDHLRSELSKYGFLELLTPMLETFCHWGMINSYRSDRLIVNANENFGLRSNSCHAHCLVYNAVIHSYCSFSCCNVYSCLLFHAN